MAKKQQLFKLKFICHLPDKTKAYRNNYFQFYQRVAISFFDDRMFKKIKYKKGLLYNKWGDEYVVFVFILKSWRGKRYFTIDSSGTIENATENFLKSFDDCLTLFPRKINSLH